MKSTLGAICAVSLALIYTCGSAGAFAAPPPPSSAISARSLGHHVRPRLRNDNGTSTNWSGYAVETSLSSPQSNVVTDVKGTWTVPAVSGAGLSSSYCSIWVGIDGYSSSTVEQLGTDSDMSSGTPVYNAWYEMYPRASVNISGFTVKPGDVITAEVHYTGGTSFVLSMSNVTEGEHFSITKSPPRNSTALRSSAEWVVEAPTVGGSLAALAYYGQANFSACSATINGVTGSISNSSWQNDPITMQSSTGMNQSVPSALSPDGSSFTMTDVMISYTVAAAASPTAGGSVAVNTGGPYYYGSVLSISETTNPGYTFAGWKATGGSISNSSAATTSLTISTNTTLTASFTPLTFCTLTVSACPAAGGTIAVSPSQASYLSGAVISISETTNPGYTFACWTATGGTISNSTAQTASLTITGNCTLKARFTLNSYSGTETDVGGTIALSNSGPYTYGQVIAATESANPGYIFTGWSVTGSVALSSSSAATTSLTVYGNFVLTANFSAATLAVSAALDNTWVYQNTPVTTMNRLCRTLSITVPQDSWSDQNFTVQVSTSGSGVVIPSLTFVSAGGSGTVTPTASFVFTGSSAPLYLIGGPLQPDGVTGTGSCTVTLQLTGDQSGAANAVTVQAALTVRRLGDTTGDGFVTTADRVQLMMWINGLPTPDQTLANFDLDGDGAVTGNDLAVLNAILNNLAVP